MTNLKPCDYHAGEMDGCHNCHIDVTRPIEDELRAKCVALTRGNMDLIESKIRTDEVIRIQSDQLEKAKEELKEISTGKGRSGTPNHEAVVAVQALKDIEGEG